MLNENIKIDLHIHSIASKYKESVGVVDQSTIENLPVLFKKLETEGINLISFTDHNTFDSKLYIEAEKFIRLGSYPSVKGIIAGIEFDVLLDTAKPCHILAYFDCKAKEDYETMVQADGHLAEKLSRLSDNVKFIVMEDGKCGSCIIEMPDGIIDMSVDTQLENIHRLVDNANT